MFCRIQNDTALRIGLAAARHLLVFSEGPDAALDTLGSAPWKHKAKGQALGPTQGQQRDDTHSSGTLNPPLHIQAPACGI
jgi:hypothetical protein